MFSMTKIRFLEATVARILNHLWALIDAGKINPEDKKRKLKITSWPVCKEKGALVHLPNVLCREEKLNYYFQKEACSLCLALGFPIDRSGALDHSCFNLPVFYSGDS